MIEETFILKTTNAFKTCARPRRKSFCTRLKTHLLYTLPPYPNRTKTKLLDGNTPKLKHLLDTVPLDAALLNYNTGQSPFHPCKNGFREPLRIIRRWLSREPTSWTNAITICSSSNFYTSRKNCRWCEFTSKCSYSCNTKDPDIPPTNCLPYTNCTCCSLCKPNAFHVSGKYSSDFLHLVNVPEVLGH